ncbi:MAG TPA: hypothetical protein VIY51_13635 [Xanthobacteraceae bacterium]
MLIYRVLSAVAAAAFGAALMMALPGFNHEADAGTPAPVIKTEQPASAPLADACTQQAWPYYGASCLRDSAAASQARVVRIVSTDRLPK